MRHILFCRFSLKTKNVSAKISEAFLKITGPSLPEKWVESKIRLRKYYKW